VSKHTTKDFSEWLLGHSGSTYWNVEEDDTKELYLKCMKYLTFLDYATVETVGADFESKLEEQEKRHQEQLKQMEEKYDEKYNQIIDAMSKNPILSKVKADVLKKKIKRK
jgi:hypothetical protein